MNTAQLPAAPEATLFDHIKRTTDSGTEYWSARELMPLLGYESWRRFFEAIERAKLTAQNQGHQIENLFAVTVKKSEGGRPAEDVHLARFAAYLVAMNGDPRKAEVASAQAYFAVQTRIAETRPAPAEMSRMEILQLAMAAEKENQELRAQAEINAPKVGYFDTMVADNDYHLLRSIASDLNVGERDLRLALKFSGWIYSDTYRRRNSKGEIVTEYQWSEYADKKSYFHRAMNHDAPLFKGNVSYTLKATTAGAAAITRLVARINAKYGSVKAALPELEKQHLARKNSEAKEVLF